MPTRTRHRPTLLALAIMVTGVVPFGVSSGTATAQDDTPWRLPVAPPRCTEAQADSGDVADCLLASWSSPTEQGWGTPPAPGVGDGWVWNGYTYAGSPALAAWERERIGANDGPLAGFGAGYFETHVEAQPLFEGFLDEITAGGYDIRHASAYSFRCTSGNGGWNCPTGRVEDLSLHAYGLAIDMNSDANPIRGYSGVGGATACATPIETDLPRWVIRTAEKWGLYWGGYGWNSGCPDTTTFRTTVYRDPPHFEFRGTVEQARAIAAFNLRNDPNVTCFAVVDDRGEDAERCTRTGRPGAGWRLPVQVDVPDGTAAVLVNVAATEPAERGHLSLEDCAPRSGPRSTAALTFAAGETIATMAVVPLDADGRFCVYSNSSVHRVIDVVARLAEPPADPVDVTSDATSDMTGDGDVLWFEPGRPTRLTDTRVDGTCTAPDACEDGPVPDRGEHLVDADGGRARLANIAVTESTARGYLQAGGCGELGPDRDFANLNYVPAATRSNLAFVRGNDDGACVFALSSAHVVVDELGSFDTTAGLGWDLSSSGRLLDTRECSDAWCDGRPAAGTVIRLPVDTDAPAVAVALTATGSDDRGYVWAGPCSVLDGRDRPPTANLNHAAGQTTTNLAVVTLEEGEMCLYNRAAGHVVVDLQAELVEDATLGVVPLDPTRIHDSRQL